MGRTRQQGPPDARKRGPREGDAAARPARGHARRPAARLEEREVVAADPRLSPQTNAMVTEELREVVGADRVGVPADRPHASRGEVSQRQGALGYLNQHRFELVRATSIMLTFGAIIALITRDWWVLPLAAGVHALGTMLVTLTIVRMTTMVEHPSPDVAAAMTEDGVSSPDGRFTQMVEEYSQVPERGAGEVLSPGYNERSVPAGADAPTAAAEQGSAMTPTEDPSVAGGEGGAPDYFIWVTAFSLLCLSIALPAAMGGGWLWLLTAIMVPLLAGWVLMQRLMYVRNEKVHLQGRGPLAAIVVGTAIAVAAFCAVVAIAFAH